MRSRVEGERAKRPPPDASKVASTELPLRPKVEEHKPRNHPKKETSSVGQHLSNLVRKRRKLSGRAIEHIKVTSTRDALNTSGKTHLEKSALRPNWGDLNGRKR